MPADRLLIAIAEDRLAKHDALEAGMLASQPLTSVRLAELCALGERMMFADLRKADAERDLQDVTISRPRSVDVLAAG
jgi:hypothetical protein